MQLGVDSQIYRDSRNPSNYSAQRTEGYAKAFAEENLPVADSNIMYLDKDLDARDMIIRRINDIKPTAIIAGTNIIARDTVKACKELSLSFPNDISLVMFDDVDWASLLDITTVSQPINDIGHFACRSIINQINMTTLQLPSDSTSRRTPLLMANGRSLPTPNRDFHPRDDANGRRTIKKAFNPYGLKALV
ncbi:substrate-binding domain-containing protein [Paenibacillus sp. FSL H7-0331]|uniref:substrate-binding domain-containing protein n=1 Tax=Paenibacillus sp. FSL H7-0331 TaxID=1920421 RepID=UPI00096C20F5|nr:substrate-binding domain-containing protein [Paenibacillus sp. FSL H7-0331]OMF15835.1 hypothetical protein BK127_16065 [Paenibacillus sp. FSL H7-0331]